MSEHSVSEHGVMAARTALAGGLPVNDAVAAAFRAVPRHEFLPELAAVQAYRDVAVVTKSDADGLPVSASTQPALMALMLDQLGLAPGQRVLEIGTGTGYNAALIAHLVEDQRSVVTVEVDTEVADRASRALAATGFGGIRVLCADGALGAPDYAPFDRVIVTAGAWDIPPAWLAQLAARGRIVLPLSVRGIQLSVALDRVDGYWTSRSAVRCQFIRVVGAFGGPESVLALGPQPGLHACVVDGRAPDADVLYHALAGSAVEVPTGLWAADVPELADLDFWLTVTEPALTRVSLLGRHEGKAGQAQQRIANLMRLGGLVSGAGSGPLGIAALNPPAGAGQGRPGAFPIAVQGYGLVGGELAARLASRATIWHELSRPGTGRLEIAAHPPRTELVGLSGGIILRRPHVWLSVGWPSAPRIADDE